MQLVNFLWEQRHFSPMYQNLIGNGEILLSQNLDKKKFSKFKMNGSVSRECINLT